MHRNMNAYRGLDVVSTTPKLVDVSKYNLRCNRNISEKMTKKDFVYDIRTPVQTVRKFEVQRRPIVLPLQLQRKQSVNSKMPHYSVISEKMDNGGSGDATFMVNRRTLGYKCNSCYEPIATLFSLSTHVKSHCQKYCKICYWVLHANETMDQHIGNYHRIKPEINNLPMSQSII